MDKKNAFDKTPQGRWDTIEDKYYNANEARSISHTGWKTKRKATAKKYKPKRKKK